MAKNDFAVQADTTRLQQIIQQLPGGASDLLAAVATEMVADIQQGMGSSPPGRTYRRGNIEHVASQPGYPPTPDTGELKASITHAKTGDMEETIHDAVEHGAYLEFGTEDIEPRPFMRPVFEDWRRDKFAGFLLHFPLIRG